MSDAKQELLEKPADKADNLRMLLDLNGNVCEVVTGVTVGEYSLGDAYRAHIPSQPTLYSPHPDIEHGRLKKEHSSIFRIIRNISSRLTSKARKVSTALAVSPYRCTSSHVLRKLLTLYRDLAVCSSVK